MRKTHHLPNNKIYGTVPLMKLSIIIPTVGRSTLRDVLAGIMNSQNFSVIAPEIIVVRDAVEGPFFAELETKFPCVTWFATKEKSYAGGARNLGIENAKGDVIAFLGDDTVPQPEWLKHIFDFHITHSEKERVLLGKVSWSPDLAQDQFHQWLENNAQFAFASIAKYGATWRHFYTSNISLKKAFIGNERFSNQFTGWGFEDTEFGYRLSKKGMKISYERGCEVFHNHKQDARSVWEQTRNARKNAAIFETLHPEIHLLPRTGKRFLLHVLIMFSYLIPTQKMKWWREWKRSWLK